jgi:hypothetical protein
VRDDVPAALDNVIATAMAKDPAARYATATALVSAARSAAADATTVAEPTVPAAPVTVPAPRPPEPAPPPPVEAPAGPARRGRRRLVLLAVAAILGAAAVAGGVYALVARDDSAGGETVGGLQDETTDEQVTQQQQQRDYVQAVDALLRNSADTRGDLARLIADVQSRGITLGDARDSIETIINQRLGLRDDIAAIPAPEPYGRAKELLRRSITLSLQDDIAVRRWINAFYGDLPSASQRLSEVTRLGEQATAAKERFVAEYNRVRRETLGLGPLAVGTRY